MARTSARVRVRPRYWRGVGQWECMEIPWEWDNGRGPSRGVESGLAETAGTAAPSFDESRDSLLIGKLMVRVSRIS